MAPAFLLALLIVLARLDQNDTQLDTEAARFDRQFARQQIDILEKNEFWQKEADDAAHRLQVALAEQAKATGKVNQQVDIIEKTLKEMAEKERWKSIYAYCLRGLQFIIAGVLKWNN